MKRTFLGTILLICTFITTAQDTYIKEYAEQNRRVGWLYPICLYPSTLRMANISKDPDFNELVSGIEKALIYQLDSAQLAGDHTAWIDLYEEDGYEEYISFYGAQTIKIIGKEKEYVGIVKAENKTAIFYLKGAIPFSKIPGMIKTFQTMEFLDVFN